MNVSGFMKEDMVNSVDGICMSLWFSGCDIHCDGCHNQNYWEPKNAPAATPENLADYAQEEFMDAKEYGIRKSLSILGGEPLAPFNRKDLKQFLHILTTRFADYPYIRLWTGRTKEQLLEESKTDPDICSILSMVDEIIVGPFIKSLKKDLPLRGSSNQEILKKDEDFSIIEDVETTGTLKLIFKI
jgi:anaerobic ribonucleoside-triphosphate reductase activating protein